MAPAFDDYQTSRRGFLRAGGATVATGLSSLGAGCSGLPPLGTQIRYGAVDVPDASAPAYRDWLPAPSAFPEATEESDGYGVMVHVPPPADAPAWAKTSVTRGLVAYETDYVGVHVGDVDVALTTAMGGGGASVLVGDVDPDAVREAIATTSYEPDGTDAGYDVYARPDLDRAVGVLRNGLVFGNGPAALEIVRTVVDAGRGEVPRYHERDEDFDALTASAGTRRWAWLTSGGITTDGDSILEDTVGTATSFDDAGASAYSVATWLFPPTYDLTAGKVKRSLKTDGTASLPDATEVSAVDVSVDGRVATVAMYMGPDVVEDELADGAFQVPYATWSTTYDGDADRLTFHHEAGDAVRTDSLWIRGDGIAEPASAAGDVGDRVGPGDDLTVSTGDVASGDTVRLVYEPPDGNRSAALFDYDLP